MLNNQLINNFFDLLRFSLGKLNQFKYSQSFDEWGEIYRLAVKQSLVGVCYSGVCRMKRDAKPPRQILLRWAIDAERIKGLNQNLNAASSILTDFFAQKGFQSLR